MNPNIALLFPAFVSDYNGDELLLLSKYKSNFHAHLAKASLVSGIDLNTFDIAENKFLDDELRSQLMAYVFSCSVSDILKENNIKANFVAGYSMGIYAALYHSGVYAFDDGVNLIIRAYQAIVNHKGDIKFGMATIAGIDEDDLSGIMRQIQSDAEIINANSRHSFVVSGKYSEIEKIVEEAAAEGALLARLLPVSVPYHSKHIKAAALEFSDYVQKQEFSNPVVPVVSLIDQRLLASKTDISRELVNNISNKINWHKTILRLAELDARIMLECGAGKSLYKICKFIDEDIKVYPLNKLSRFIDAIKTNS